MMGLKLNSALSPFCKVPPPPASPDTLCDCPPAISKMNPYHIPAPRRSRRIADREGRRLPADVAENLHAALMDLSQSNETDVKILEINRYLDLEDTTFYTVDRRLKISLTSRRVFNRFFTAWSEYNMVLSEVCDEPTLYEGGPDGEEYRCWYLKMISEATDKIYSFLQCEFGVQRSPPPSLW